MPVEDLHQHKLLGLSTFPKVLAKFEIYSRAQSKQTSVTWLPREPQCQLSFKSQRILWLTIFLVEHFTDHINITWASYPLLVSQR